MMSELVHCLSCDNLWWEQEMAESCPSCGEDAENTVYCNPDGYDDKDYPNETE